jgi:FkbM family methyltransferase
MRSVGRSTYRLTASAIAGAMSAVPLLERPLVWLGARVWDVPGAGRLYRSVVGRYADHLRGSRAAFRRVSVGGASFIIDVTEFTTSNLYFGNRLYEKSTTGFLCRALTAGGVFVDVGANHGYFTLLAGALVGGRGRVFAFEPNPAVFAQLVAHVAMNHFDDRTELLPQALSNQPEDGATLYISRYGPNSGLSTLVPDEDRLAAGLVSPEHTVEVRVETFDRWLATSGLDRVDVMKIDTEGGEDFVVGGMTRSLREKRIGSVICETHPESRAHDALCAAGYRPRPLETVGDELINFVYARPE